MDKQVIKHICNTMTLFGAKDDLINIIQDYLKGEHPTKTVGRLQDYNAKKTDEIKDRLSRQSSTQMLPG